MNRYPIKMEYLIRFPMMVGFFLFLVMGNSVSASSSKALPWLIYHSNKAPLNAFFKYKLLIFDSEFSNYTGPLRQRGKTVLAYISLGEVGKNRKYFSNLQRKGLLLQTNSSGKANFRVDLRILQLDKVIIERILPSILIKGFDGILIDALDGSIGLEKKFPKKFQGMTKGAIRLVRSIRNHFPHIKIALNRAYDILPEIETFIDYEIGESVLTTYDLKTKSYRFVVMEKYQKHVHQLQASLKRNPKLKILTLDYWDPNDFLVISQIYNQQIKNGFSPNVGTIDLDKIIQREGVKNFSQQTRENRPGKNSFSRIQNSRTKPVNLNQ